MVDPTELFASALNDERPMVLFAGQSISVDGAATDPVLASLLSRLGLSSDPSSWKSALEAKMSDADMLWLAERFDRSVPMEGMFRVFDVGWSAVFTSSIDPRVAHRFRTRGREPEAVLSRGNYARVSRSRSRPPIYHLLGRADDDTNEARAPRSKAELTRRIASHATELLGRIGETATARGLVVIAGYEPGSDWLPLDTLLAPLSEQPGPQVLWIGELSRDQSDLLPDMLDAGIIQVVPGSLAQLVASLEATKAINLTGSAAPDEPGTITTSRGALDLTPALRLRVEASATLVDDSWTSEIDAPDKKDSADAFRNFHGDRGNFRLLVEGIGRHFAIKRDFETRLWHSVDAALRDASPAEGLIIVHGQSGTGKSVSMARLVLEARQRLKVPVLVATSRLPAFGDIEAFCNAAQEALGAATLVICDANQSPNRYRDLVAALQSRGRRFLVVGTCYRLDAKDQGKVHHYIEAPSIMTSGEENALSKLVTKFAPTAQPSVSQGQGLENALAMLYRRIPAGRSRIALQLGREAEYAERRVRERAKRTPSLAPRSQLAEQLINAGLANATTPVFVEEDEKSAFGEDAAGRLIDYVMVAGRIGCPVPLNLLIRVLGKSGARLEPTQIIHIFDTLDLFRWKGMSPEGADLSIMPRIQLEAELLCRTRLGDKAVEVQRIVELIRGVRPTGVDRAVERGFLLDLMQKLDRDGPRQDAYATGYLDFAHALMDLRRQNGVIDAAIMLRECVFRRQAIFSQSKDVSALSNDERLKILEEARATAEEALQLITSGKLRASRRTRVNLTAERASIYGYLAVQQLSRSDNRQGYWSYYLAARTAAARAIALTDDYHPIDIALWSGRDVLNSGLLSAEQRVEVVADLYSTMDIADGMALPSEQEKRYLERRVSVADALGNQSLSSAALGELATLAPAAAAFVMAKRTSFVVDTADEPFEAAVVTAAGTAANYLFDKFSEGVGDDPRCLRLLIRLRWAEATGEHLLRGERGRTPSSDRVVAELLASVTRLNESMSDTARNRERYLEGVLAWILKDFSRANQIFQMLSRDTEYEDRSRVIRRLVLTGPDGSPAKHQGRILPQSSKDDWRVRIDGSGIIIPLQSHEFKTEDLAEGRELRDFGVAFNYVGPIADPLVRRRVPS